MNETREHILYADTDEKIAKVVAALRRAQDRGEVTGLDTEFYGVDLTARSCVAESHLHLISVAKARYPRELHPRGYSRAESAVLPRNAVDHPDFRDWLGDPHARKAVHNLPVDAHTLGNCGTHFRGGINTLAMARWAWPDRARGEGFTLDSLARDFCGVGKTESYREIFRETIDLPVVKTRKRRMCECGEVPTRGHPRSATPGHKRLTLVEEITHWKESTREIPLSEVIPGHALWDRTLVYSANDAVLALAIYELATQAMNKAIRDAPWL